MQTNSVTPKPNTGKAAIRTKLGPKMGRRHLVQTTASNMRDMILAQKPDTQIGSLTDLAQSLGVGIVTIQQAARVLEHEGLLEVRRGPGGGYFGMRPDAASLARSLETYLETRNSGYTEALEMITWLDCELVPAAARCDDENKRDELRRLAARVDECETAQAHFAFEENLHDILFAMVDSPLIELLARATMRHSKAHPRMVLFGGDEGNALWKTWRRQIIEAILERDEERARFEAMRHRRVLLDRLRAADETARP